MWLGGCTAYNLSVVVAGESPATPYEVLKSPRLGELLDEARRLYDYVVIDTPPIVAFPDCRILNNWVDGWLIVVAAHRTSRKLLEESLDLMEESKTVGFVFTHDERFRANARYYGALLRLTARPGRRVPRPLTHPPMIATLALLDGCAILAALCAATFGWHRPLTGDWAADSRALALLLTLTLGTLTALYYADAYDLRAVPGAGAVRRPAAPLCRLCRGAARRRLPVLSECRRPGRAWSSWPRWSPCPCSGRPFTSSCTEGCLPSVFSSSAPVRWRGGRWRPRRIEAAADA